MKREQIIAELTFIKEQDQRFYRNWKILCDTLHAHPESPIFQAFYTTQRKALDLIAELSGIHPEAIAWFVNDNAWGECGLCSYLDGNPFPIDSIEAFVDFEILSQVDKERTPS